MSPRFSEDRMEEIEKELDGEVRKDRTDGLIQHVVTVQLYMDTDEKYSWFSDHSK